ncbi:MAG: hypothetical protein WKF99_02005 [Solirubrobacteraceae bacterium]
MSMISKLARFASSPQGRRMAQKAMEKAKDPKTRQQVDDARQKLARKRGGSSGSGPASKPPEPGPDV